MSARQFCKTLRVSKDPGFTSINHLQNCGTSIGTYSLALSQICSVQIRGTVGFEIAIEGMEGSYKLSQNRDKKNHTNIISELEKRKDENSANVANEMRKCGYVKKQ
jgi:hypothetical protein